MSNTFQWFELPKPPPRLERKDVRMIHKVPMSNKCIDQYGEIWHFYVEGDSLKWYPSGIMTFTEK